MFKKSLIALIALVSSACSLEGGEATESNRASVSYNPDQGLLRAELTAPARLSLDAAYSDAPAISSAVESRTTVSLFHVARPTRAIVTVNGAVSEFCPGADVYANWEACR